MALQLNVREDVLGHDCLGVTVAGILPESLADCAAAEVATRVVQWNNQPCPLGELFSVQGSSNDGRLMFTGDTSRVHGIGAGMTSGEVVVSGDAGRHAGERMQGGRLTIQGSADDWLACGMQGGMVHVFGSAGDHAAASLPRDPRGLNGGVVLIEGSAGQLAGSRMRRGMLAIGGDCGEGAAYELRAGTVVVAGRVDRRAAAGMRRGSLIALGPPPEIWPAFVRGSVWQPPVVGMLLKWLVRQGWQSPAAASEGPWQQWHGDLTAGGRGELFCQTG